MISSYLCSRSPSTLYMIYVKTVTLSILVLFITSFISSSNSTLVDKTMSIKEGNDFLEDWEDWEDLQNDSKITYTWDSLINRIKSREGLMLEPYDCAAGYNTIGYGHLITERDSALLEGITEKQADSLLRKDLNYSKKWVKKTLKLKGTKLIAITNFCFAFGTSKLYRSTLYKKIQKGERINKEILRWVNINGSPNSNLQEEREFELWLYTANDKRLKKSNESNSNQSLSQNVILTSGSQIN